MLFNSLTFFVFAVVFFAFWPLFNRQNNLRWAYLCTASFVFYGWWDWRFVFLIIGSGLIDYACALAMERWPRFKKPILWLSLIGNVGSLSVFKYSLFFAELVESLAAVFHFDVHLSESIPAFALILPVGISFFTFQSMSYTIDVYKGNLVPTKNILHFFSYIAMFPQLVAGPIIRARDMLGQLAQKRKSGWVQRWNGIKLIAFGLFQKTVIADNIGVMVDTAYQGNTSIDTGLFWWLVLVAFAFQIYCDFSGYSLMAKGIAKLMGYHFRINFNHPYLSTSLREFWTRWHISLSTWFRDYVYIPMGGSRKGAAMGILFMSLTMVISGLWHGAALTFVAWGAVHALFLALERVTKWPLHFRLWGVPPILSWLVVWVQILVAWNYFRAESIGQAHVVLAKLTGSWTQMADIRDLFYDPLFFLLVAVVIELAICLRKRYRALHRWYTKASMDVVTASVALAAAIYFRGPEMNFIYFQF